MARLVSEYKNLGSYWSNVEQRERLDGIAKLLKQMVGPWGLEPQTSTVSKSNQEYKPTRVDPDLFLFTMRCRRVT